MTQRGHGTRRVWLPAAFLGAFALVILGRLVQLQVLQHNAYARQTREEQTADSTFYARRGSILDRNGNVLAASVDTWNVYISGRTWRAPERSGPASDQLGKLLRMDPAAIRGMVANKNGDVLIARDVDYEVGHAIAAAEIPGVVLLPDSKRVNPEGDVGASVLGLTGLDNTGLAGIELSHNADLLGKPGKAVYERDTTGDPIPFGRSVVEEPRPGNDLVLTIDRYLQQMAEQKLDAAVKEHRAQGGSVIMMDPHTGEILALASSPGLKYSSLDLSDKKQVELLKNRAVTDLYEPGSVMKVVTAAAAIDQGLVTPDTSYVDTGEIRLYDVTIKNWDDRVYGTQTMTGVLQNSINTGAVFMVEKLGQPLFHKYLDAFGFGRTTGIDLSGEAEGIIRKPEDEHLEPPWSPVDLATQSFGQSISVTPIQMLSAIAACINGGMLMKPHLVRATIDEHGVRHDIAPAAEGRAISAQTSATIRMMLEKVVNPGWPDPMQPRNYTAGGKSGTANVPVASGYDDRQIASFVEFAPTDDPKLIVLVKLDQNQDLLTGRVAAAPVAAAILDDALNYLNVLPSADAKQVRR
ncbi:MAG: penicillin-binding protein 2 [Dehalococcoidia bacterium]